MDLTYRFFTYIISFSINASVAHRGPIVTMSPAELASINRISILATHADIGKCCYPHQPQDNTILPNKCCEAQTYNGA